MEWFDGVQWGAIAGAFGLGLRHGVDWDHVAAIADITSSQEDSRRSFLFSTLYILGHAFVVTTLGLVAVGAGATIPAWLDGAMGRIIGATLVALGVYVVVSLVRHGRDVRLRSRWMLAIGGARRALDRVRSWRASVPDPVVVDHDHEHPADEVHVTEPAAVAAAVAVRARTHRHRHLHLGSMPEDPFIEYGRGTSFLVGMLHGVGAETPTQMVLFATAAGAGTAWVGAAFLLAFVFGLILSNTAVALASRTGMLSAARNFAAYATLSLVVAAISLYLGTVYLLGLGNGFPAISG